MGAYDWKWSAKVVEAYLAALGRASRLVDELFEDPLTPHQLTYYLSVNSPVWAGYKTLARGLMSYLDDTYMMERYWPTHLSDDDITSVYQRSIFDIKRALDSVHASNRLKKQFVLVAVRLGKADRRATVAQRAPDLFGKLDFDLRG